PLTTYFDLQAGLRSDLDSRAGRTWAAFGVQGLAPYFIDVSATAYASDSGQYAAKLEGSTDLLITQRLILQPQIEMNVYTKADAARGIGAGLSDLDAGLRLRYDINRKFAPYVGVVYTGKYGGTADFARAAGEPSGGLQFVFGVRTWL
ncbi:MAG: copper resistance protein B, partial [Alphaproteobacteria bacterium]|nr:copper resistance protein B [Alphaproteobacteria bacterium]